MLAVFKLLHVADGLGDEPQMTPGQDAEPDPERGAEAASDGEEEDDRPPVIDTYSDISDKEIEGMLLSEAESQSKKSVWEFNNADWEEKQEAREAARKQMQVLEVCRLPTLGAPPRCACKGWNTAQPVMCRAPLKASNLSQVL